jgi:outer membrane protein assembly factor BamE (lipoprotein component of BamABCDE complex)
MFKKIIPISIIVILSLTGCVSNPPQQQGTMKNSNLTHGQVQLTLKKGVTSKTEVLETFGAPNITTIDAAQREVWTYQRNATVANSNSSNSYGTIILFGSNNKAAGFEQSSKTITLIIKFDDTDKVVDFKSRSTSF